MTDEQMRHNPPEAEHFVSKEPQFDVATLREAQVISPYKLQQDNQSRETEQRIEEWREGRKQVVLRCSDARLYLASQRAIVIASLGAAGSHGFYEPLFSRANTEMIVIVTHFAAEPIEKRRFLYVPGEPLRGCGAQEVKEKLEENGNNGEKGATEFVDEHIKHKDVIYQSIKTVINIGTHTNKPIIAFAQNHLTGELYALAYSLYGGRLISAGVPVSHVINDIYVPKEIYGERPPFIPSREIPSEFEPFMERQRQQLTKLHRKFPKYAELQAVQNPRMLIISDHTVPTETRYPETTRLPGSFFRICMIKAKGGEINQDFIAQAVMQADYPLSHSNHNFADKSKAFALLNTIVIDTDSMNKSLAVAQEILQTPTGNQWAYRDGNQIILVETKRGKMTDDPQLF